MDTAYIQQALNSLPPGFELDKKGDVPPPPPGFVLDEPYQEETPKLTPGRVAGRAYHEFMGGIGDQLSGAATVVEHEIAQKDRSAEYAQEPDQAFASMTQSQRDMVARRMGELSQTMPRDQAYKQAVSDVLQQRQGEKVAIRENVSGALRRASDSPAFKMPQEYEQSSGYVEDVVGGLASFGPTMVTTAVNAPAGLAQMYLQILGNSYDQKVEQGVDPERAYVAASFEALANAPLESAGTLVTLGALKRAVTKKTGQFIIALTEASAAEGLEEYLQSYPEEIANVYAANPDLSPREIAKEVVDKVSTGEFQKQAGYQAGVGAGGGALLMGAGKAAAAPFKLAQYKSEKQKQIDKQKQGALGDEIDALSPAVNEQEVSSNYDTLQKWAADNGMDPNAPIEQIADAYNKANNPQAYQRQQAINRTWKTQPQEEGQPQAPPPVLATPEQRQEEIKKYFPDPETGEIDVLNPQPPPQYGAEITPSPAQFPAQGIPRQQPPVPTRRPGEIMPLRKEEATEASLVEPIVQPPPVRPAILPNRPTPGALRRPIMAQDAFVEGFQEDEYDTQDRKGIRPIQPQEEQERPAEPARWPVQDEERSRGERTAGPVLQEPLTDKVDIEANEAATSELNETPEPTEAQKQAGNYKMGHIKVQGFDITIENPHGSKRTGTDKDGETWESQMVGHYGYFKRSEGKDGDQVDVFVNKGLRKKKYDAYIVDQIDPKTGEFDEHKVMLGYPSEESARKAYLANYEEGWNGLGDITPVSSDALKSWLEEGKHSEPYAKVESPEKSAMALPYEPKGIPAKIETEYDRYKEAEGFDSPIELHAKKEKEKLDKAESLWEKTGEEALEQYRSRFPKGAIVLVHEDGGKGVIIHPSTKRKGKFQKTTWDKRGFVGDDQHNSEAEAMHEAIRHEHYKIADPQAFEEIAASRLFRKAPEYHELIKKYIERQKAEGPAIPLGEGKKTPMAAPEAEKQPWEMTKAEYNGTLSDNARKVFGSFQHRNFVLNALAGGKNVPKNVIEEYPGIVDEAQKVKISADKVDAQMAKRKENKEREIQKKDTEKKQQIKSAGQIVDDLSYKEPWEITLKQYVIGGRITNRLKKAHKTEVKAALSEGKPVPAEVLADYPDLAQGQKAVETPAPKPRKPRESQVRTLRGAIKKMGGLSFPAALKGELKDMDIAVKFLSKKTGIPLDVAESDLKSSGWLRPNESLLEVLREGKTALKRRPLSMESSEIPENELTEAEKRFKEEMEYEPELPAEGNWISVNAEDLPEGRELLIADDGSVDGWDTYKVIEKDPFSITLEDGQIIELTPLDKVLVREEDLAGAPAEQKQKETNIETISPNGEYVDWNESRTKEKDGLKGTEYATYREKGSFKAWRPRSDIERMIKASETGDEALILQRETYGKQPKPKGEKKTQMGLGLVDPNEPDLFAGVETKKEKALREYNEYISSLSADQRARAGELVIENPESPSMQRLKIEKAITAPAEPTVEINKKQKNAIKRLRETAKRTRSAAEEKYNQDRLENTSRRARMAASARADAAKSMQIADTMLKIADAIEAGEVKYLFGIKAKANVELLDGILQSAHYSYLRSKNDYASFEKEKNKPISDEAVDFVKYPSIQIDSRTETEIRNKLEKVRGGKKIAQKVFNISDPAVATEIVNFANKYNIYLPWFIEENLKRINSLNRIGIKNKEELKGAIQELKSLRAEEKKEDPVKAAERKLIGQKIAGWFPTPDRVVSTLLDKADIQENDSVLEPSAGSGPIADMIREKHPDSELSVIEIAPTLRELLKTKGYEIAGNDFLEHQERYDKIVMNPPFEKMQDIDHVYHAYDLLKPGGRVVSIMSQGPFFRSDKKAKDFREWLSDKGYSEKLPENSFKGAKQLRETGVAARFVVIDKPDTTLGKSEETATKKPLYQTTRPTTYKKGDRVYYPGDQYRKAGTGKVTGTYTKGQYYVTFDSGETVVLSDKRLRTVEKKRFKRILPGKNKQRIEKYLKDNKSEFDNFEYREAEPGERFYRVVWEPVGEGYLEPNELDEVSLPKGENVQAVHVSNEPEKWADVLIEDYARDGNYRIIEIEAMPGDIVVEDVQQAIPTEKYGRTLDSNILVTGRDLLRRRKDKVYFETTRRPADAGITTADIQNMFEGQHVGINAKDGSVWVRTKSGDGVSIYEITAEEADRIGFSVRSGKMNENGEFVRGAFVDGKIYLVKGRADKWTAEHERFHWIDRSGILNNRDRRIINNEVFRRGQKPDEEARAYFVEDALRTREFDRKTPVGRVLQKIADFVDSLVNLFKRTHRGILRDIESGKIYDRKGQKQETRVPAYERAAARWYSQMEQFIEQKGISGKPENVKNMLNAWANKGLIKKEELEWSGVNDWLDAQTGKVTKEDVLNYLRENNLRVEEVVRGGPGDFLFNTSPEEEAFKKFEEEFSNRDENWSMWMFEGVEEEKNSAWNNKAHIAWKSLGRTKQNYIEEEGNEEDARDKFEVDFYELGWDKIFNESEYNAIKKDAWNQVEADYINQIEEQRDFLLQGQEIVGSNEPTKFSQYQEPGGENYRELLITMPGVEMPGQQYTSAHWDEPNVLVHVRFNERTDKDGNKILFIEEVQSDWHQAGRKEGYRQKLTELPEGYIVERHGVNWRVRREKAPEGQRLSLGSTKKEAIANALEQLNEAPSIRDAVPDAPFKTSDKWSTLAMKRMVRYAAENGFDKIAWTPGEIQADRYDLSKHFKEIAYAHFTKENRNMEAQAIGEYHIEGILTNGSLHNFGSFSAEELPGVVGKEMADKIVGGDGELSTARIVGGIKGARVLSGIDLKVGGEGMKGFYDKILPSAVNKYFNKKAWGSAKVTPGEIITQKQLSLNYIVKETYDGKYKIFAQTEGLEDLTREERNAGLTEIDGQEYDTYRKAFNAAAKMQDAELTPSDKTIEAWTLPITPEMKSKALREGMPLFQKGNIEKLFTKDLDESIELVRRKRTDMGGRERETRPPQWLAKKYPKFAKMYARQKTRDKTRLKHLAQSIAKTEAFYRMKGNDFETLNNLVWALEGRDSMFGKGKPISAKKFTREKDGTYSLNDEHYTQYREFLDGITSLSDAVKDAYIDIRKSLDEDLALVFKTMSDMDDIDPTVIDEFRRAIGNIHNYFPHMRYGTHYFQIIDKNTGKVIYREHFNAARDYQKLSDKAYRRKINSLIRKNKEIQELLKKFPDVKFDINKVEKIPEEVFSIPVPIEAVEAVMNAAIDRISDQDAKKAFRQLLPQAVADALKTRGWGAHMIKRKNIPGFEKKNIKKVLFDYKAGLYGWLTKMEAARDFSAMMRDVDAKKEPNLWGAMRDYSYDMLENSTQLDRMIDTARGIFFAKYLGLNFKTATLNLTQQIIAGWPRLGMETRGASLKTLRGAAADLVAVFKNKKNLSEEEQQLLTDFYEEGQTSAQFLSEMRGQTRGKGGGLWDMTMSVLGWPMGVAERFNRCSLALAAFRVARNGEIVNKDTLKHYALKRGEKASYETAKEFAEEIVSDAHFDYGKYNRPGMFRGSKTAKIASSGYTFRTFTHHLINLWSWMWKNGGPGKKAAMKSLAAMIAIGGITSIPLYKTFMHLIRQLTGDDWGEEVVDKLLGEESSTLRDMVVYGVPAATGFTIGGSIGMEMPIFDKIQVNESIAEQVMRDMGEIIGIPYAIMEDVESAGRSAASGQGLRALEYVAPSVVSNMVKGYRLYHEGQKTMSGRPIALPGETEARKLSLPEAVGKFFGYQPTSSSKSWDLYQQVEDFRAYRIRKKRGFVKDFMEALEKDDSKKYTETADRLRDWNYEQVASGHIEYAIMPNEIIDMIKDRNRPTQPPAYMRQRALELKQKKYKGE